jgi:hypothetical protein
MTTGLLANLVERLHTRDELERALALAVASLLVPTKNDNILLKICDPRIGELSLTEKQAKLYASVRLKLYEQRR